MCLIVLTMLLCFSHLFLDINILSPQFISPLRLRSSVFDTMRPRFSDRLFPVPQRSRSIPAFSRVNRLIYQPYLNVKYVSLHSLCIYGRPAVLHPTYSILSNETSPVKYSTCEPSFLIVVSTIPCHRMI